MYTLQGVVDATTSAGEMSRFTTGEGALVEDITGKGHFPTVIGDLPLVMIVVTLAD